MKVSELLAMRPVTLGVTGVLLTDGRALVTVLDEFNEVELSPGRVSIANVSEALLKLSPEAREAFLALEVAEDTVEEAPALTPPTLTLSPEYQREAKQRASIGFIMCLVLAIETLALTGVISYVAVVRKEFPDWLLISVISFPVWALSWFFMGLINKERADVVSAVLGIDRSNQPGMMASILEVILNRRRAG
jgi:hypothetical protein